MSDGASGLSDVQIDLLVERYLLQMARYETAALHVEQRLRRALRAAALRVLLSSRAKHPEDLRDKLRRRRADPRYLFPVLEANLNSVVTDLAGCRVMVYHPQDERAARDVVAETFPLAADDGPIQRHNKPSGYRATHVHILLSDVEDGALVGAVCEVQICSIASHVFNELEHDIRYKDKHVPPSARVEAFIEDVLHSARVLDRMVAQLLDDRADELRRRTAPLADPADLKYALERGAGRPLRGDFARLFRLLDSLVHPLTVSAVDALGDVSLICERGEATARRLGVRDADDVVQLVLGLHADFASEMDELARAWRGPTTPLKRAILRVAELSAGAVA